MASLADLVPEIQAYQQAQQQGQQRQLGQLQQVGALQGILAKVQAAQKEQQLRGVLSQLGPNATQDQVAAAVRPFASADDLLKSATSSADRKVAMENAAAARRDSLQARLYDIDTRLEDKALGREQQERLSREGIAARTELAKMGFDVRREIAANRPGPTPLATDQGYFERGANGLTPMMNPNKPDEQLRPPSLVSGNNQRAIALRKMYDTNPEVKLANSLEPKVGPIAQYVAEVGKGMGNSVGDAELVKLWLMTTHPKGDQISNLDYRTIEKMPDLWGRVKNVAGNFVFGKTLDVDTRASMWNSVSQKYKATDAMRSKYKTDVLGRGKQMGIDESLIFTPPQE